MKATVLKYNVLIKKEGKHFVAYVPTLGISDFGSSIDLAKRHVEKAIETHVEGLIKTGTEIPMSDTQEFFISQAQITLHKVPHFAF